MADKDFIVKNGIVVSNNLIYATADSGEVGINTTNPTANLHVVGTGFFSTTLTANIVQANSISTNSISSSSLSLTGNMSIGGSLTVANDSAVSRNFGVSGNTNLVGNVTIGGTTSLGSLTGTVSSFSNVSISNFGNIQNANLTNLTVSTSTNISGTATFNNAVVAGFTPTATNHVVNKNYTDNTFMPKAGGTFTGDITIQNANPQIYFADTNWGTFRVHCNDGRIGFLPLDGAWGCYMDNSKQWNIVGSLNTINNWTPTNGAIRLTPNMHLNALAGYGIYVNWDSGGAAAGTAQFAVGNGGGAAMFVVNNLGDSSTARDSYVARDLYVNSGYGSAGKAYGVRAWIRYDANAGAGGVNDVVYGLGNISSMTALAGADGTNFPFVRLFTFITPMPDANYAVVATLNEGTTWSSRYALEVFNQTSVNFMVSSWYYTYPSGGIVVVR